MTKFEILTAIHALATEGGFETPELSAEVVTFAEKELASLARKAEKASKATAERKAVAEGQAERILSILAEVGRPIGATELFMVEGVTEVVSSVQALTARLTALKTAGKVKAEKVKRVTVYSVAE